jgi:hypothetical protein
MGFVDFTTDEFDQDKGIKSTTFHKIRANLEWVRHAFQYNRSQVSNREFELVTNDQPDMWDCTTYEGGYVGVTTSTSWKGLRSLMIVHDGTTRSGGQAISDYIPMSTVSGTPIYFQHRIWGDNIPMGLYAIFYNGDLSPISTVGAITTGRGVFPANAPTTFTVPAGARWVKVKIMTSTAAGATEPGTVYYDSFNFSL